MPKRSHPRPTAPAWPAINLRDQVLAPAPHPAFPAAIVLIRDFWPLPLCREYVAVLQRLPMATVPKGRPQRGLAARVNDRFQLDDAVFARRLWTETGLGECLRRREDLRHIWGGELVGLNPNIRVYRYSQGQFFAPHYDESNEVTLASEAPSPITVDCRTTWTLLLYLSSSSSGCHGGETIFYPSGLTNTLSKQIVVEPETGMVLLHKHGHDCLLHEGRQVILGEKWVIRTDLCVKK